MKVSLLIELLPGLDCLVLNLAVIPDVFISGGFFIKYNGYENKNLLPAPSALG
jgi:hypothetical protein